MSALPYLKYSITNLYLFPTYATREDYEKATGQLCPEWNPYRQPKSWFDPKAKASVSRKVVYNFALAVNPATGAPPLLDADGRPQLDALVLDRDEAATVNIPPKGPGDANIPGAGEPEIPAPMRALDPNEELYLDFGGLIAVRNKELYAQLTDVGFTQRSRDLLERIAEKLGVA